MDIKIMGLLITLVSCLFILVGVIIAKYIKNNSKFIDFNIALAFSVIIMIIYIDILPEVTLTFGIKNVWIFIIAIIVGIIIVKVLDKFVPNHEHKHTNNKNIKSNYVHIGIVSTYALIIHNIIEGMAIYNLAVADSKAGLLMAIGVGCHNLPIGMMSASVLAYEKDKKKFIYTVALLMLSSFVGGIMMLLLNNNINNFVIAIILSITTGMLFYLCFSELLPKIKHSKNKKYTISGIIIGIILILITMFI